MKILKFICILFAVVFSCTTVSCFINFASNPVGMSLLAIVSIAIVALCIFGAVKAGGSIKESGGDTIVKTRIIDAYGKTSTASAVTRGAVGNAVAGPVGAIVGASTAKSNRSTTFLIFYKDGKKKTRTVPNNSFEYQKYIKYLEG